MNNPVNNKKISEHMLAFFEAQKNLKKADKGFDKLLHNKANATKNIHPIPHHRAKPQSITMGQAQKLAKYAPIIRDCAQKHNIPVELICGVILQESGGNVRAHSPVGAKGLMQLMPQTARRFGVTNSFDPRQNIEGGTKYLRWLMDHFKGNVELTLAGYNAGEHNVEKHGMRIPPFRETQNYVPSVLGYALAMVQMLRQSPATPTVPPSNAKLA